MAGNIPTNLFPITSGSAVIVAGAQVPGVRVQLHSYYSNEQAANKLSRNTSAPPGPIGNLFSVVRYSRKQ